MAFKLTPEAQARAQHYEDWARVKRGEMQALSNDNLVAVARLYMANMSPMQFAPGEHVYDATMWHIILPELLARVKEADS